MALGLAARGEFLCVGKDPAAPDSCEDRAVLALPDAAAVIDGATDIGGLRFGGRTGGWLAADALSRFVLAAAADGAIRRWSDAELVSRANGVLRDLYERLGILDVARAAPERRFRAGACFAIARDDGVRIVNVSMPGVRIDGAMQGADDPPDGFERLLTGLRALLWHDPDLAPLEAPAREAALRKLLVPGRPAADAPYAAAWARAEAKLRAGLPESADPRRVEAAFARGLWGSRCAHPGDPSHSPALDGFHDEAPPHWATTLAYGRFRTVEMFSDGYQAAPAGVGVAAWEAAAAEVNRTDPHRVGPHAAIKGCLAGGHHDDRSLVILHAQAGFPSR